MPNPDDLTVEKIDSIAALTDPLLRNVLITQSYCELSASFARRMGAGANWCTFATWASKQAGQTIRQEDLQRTKEELLKNGSEIETALLRVAALAKRLGARNPLQQLCDAAIHSITAHSSKTAAESVSRGNKKVFEEIAAVFARFIASCIDDVLYDQSHIDLFCQQLKPGFPPEGQAFLAMGFTHYYRALFEQDPVKKAQLNFLANLCVGFHEQNRLQPEIAAALTASIDIQQVKSDVLDKLFSGTHWFTRLQVFIRRLFGPTLLDKGIEALVQLLQPQIRLVLTAHLMTLTIPPDNCLRLGRDLSVPFPASLVTLTNTDLLAMLAQVDPTRDSVRESGASDWANLTERMHYIADLFRCFHQSGELFDAAFTEEQVAAMKNGQLPEGKL